MTAPTVSSTADAAKVAAYEKLGVFYLGRRVDPKSGDSEPTPLLYDSKDLVTHAVIIGMTGSGKTGLGIALLEEAAIDGVPALVVDPKGDLANLLLTFPELAAEDFRPWVQEDEARRQGLEPDAFAAAQATLWREGLLKWDQDGERIRRLRQAVDLAVYTPGSEAGLPISILSSFAAPPAALRGDADLFGERVATATASLLGLLGLDADPIRSRESVLLANLFQDAWQKGEDLDLPALIQRIQSPPLERIGVMPLESFFPAGDRFALAMALNNLLAAPGFASWLAGEPLDVDRLLYTPSGKPRVAVLSIAHLGDAERMFFVSLLLNETLAWMRSRPGTSSLRALFYMDEIFGYLPPVGNPPSKKPILTLLKQARAFGLGLVLATQNPVDLDYKALSNIGTWFLGRLQTERDQERVMDGLLAAGGGRDRQEIGRLLAGLDKRVFLLHNVHEEAPELFKVRWVLSYLRGPLTRDQIRLLSEGRKTVPGTAPAKPLPAAADAARPLLPPGIEERFLPARGGGEIRYRPHLVAEATVHYVDARRRIESADELLLLAAWTGDDVDWERAQPLAGTAWDDLEEAPDAGARFAALPASAGDARRYPRWSKVLAEHLYRERRLDLWQSPSLGVLSRPGESERDFRIRLADAAREERDRQTDAIRKKYAVRFIALEDRVRRAEYKVEKERQEARSEKLESVVSIGSSILGAFLGRNRFSATTVKRASGAVGRSMREGRDVDRAEDDLETLRGQVAELGAEVERAIEEVALRFDPQLEALETVTIKPKKSDVDVRRVALLWVP